MNQADHFILETPFRALRAIPRNAIAPIRDRMNLRDIGGNGLPDAKILVSWNNTGIWIEFISAVPLGKKTIEDISNDFYKTTHVQFFVVPDTTSGKAFRVLLKPSGAKQFSILRYGEITNEKNFTCSVTQKIHPQFWECAAFIAFADLGSDPAAPGDVWRFDCFYRYLDAFGASYFSGLSNYRPFASGQAMQTTNDYKNFTRLYFDDEPLCRVRKLVCALNPIEDKFEKINPQKTAALRSVRENQDYIALFNQLNMESEIIERASLLSGKDAFLTNSAQNRDFSVSFLPTSIALKRGPDFWHVARPLPEIIKCSAAKGEVESFQLILASTPQAASDIAIRWESEQGMPGMNWGEIRDVTAYASFQGTACHGSFSDIIIDTNPDAVSIPYASYTPLFCKLTVPGDAKNGIYRGAFIISNRTGSIRAPVELTVRNFALPVRPSLTVVFCFFEEFYKKWFGLDELAPATREAIFEFLLKYRVTPSNIYSKEPYPAPEDIKKFLSKGLNFCTLGYLAPSRAELTDEAVNTLAAEFRKRLDAFKACGAQDICCFYGYDEIVPRLNAEKLEAVQRLMRRFRHEFPDLKCLQTSKYATELADCFNVWIPPFDHLAESRLRAAEDHADAEFWWYSADGPEKPYPNFHLGYPALEMRMVMTLSWKNRVKGILHWCINREWASNAANRREIEKKPSNWDPAFQSALSSEEVRRCGMGNYLYPAPDGGIYPSLRLENLRDGIEDYEYYAILRNLCNEPNADPALREQAETLLAVPPEIAKSACDYTNDPETLMAFRDQVAILIEKMIQTNKEHPAA